MAKQRRTPLASRLMLPGLVVLGLGGTLAALWAAGIVKLPSHDRGLYVPPHAVPVLLSAQNIPAYTRITREHVWNPQKGGLEVTYLDPAYVSSEMLTGLPQIAGRVLRFDKPKGYVFTESDFFPKKTRPGLVAGIPPGKRAVRVEADKVAGVVGLQPGDHFDVVAALPIDPKAFDATSSLGGFYKSQLSYELATSNLKKQATVRPIVQNGVVIEPVQTRQVPVAAASLTNGTTYRTRPVQEIVVAVNPEEVGPLMEALAVGAEITCIPRSGQPDDDPHVETPALNPKTPFSRSQTTLVDTISGSDRSLQVVPRAAPEKKE